MTRVFTLNVDVTPGGEGYKLELDINPAMPMEIVKKLARELTETLEPMGEEDVVYVPLAEEDEEE